MSFGDFSASGIAITPLPWQSLTYGGAYVVNIDRSGLERTPTSAQTTLRWIDTDYGHHVTITGSEGYGPRRVRKPE
jgi:hypothetical protein